MSNDPTTPETSGLDALGLSSTAETATGPATGSAPETSTGEKAPTVQTAQAAMDAGSGYTPPTTPISQAAPQSVTPERRTDPSVPTVLWGLIAALVAAGAITHEVSDVDLNLGIVAPLILLAAGVILVVWGIAGFGRARTRA